MAQKGCTHMNEVSPTALCREGLSCALQLREEDDAQRSYEAHVILHDNSSCEAQYRIQEFSFCSPFPLRNVCTFSQRVSLWPLSFQTETLKGLLKKFLISLSLYFLQAMLTDSSLFLEIKHICWVEIILCLDVFLI